MHHSDCARRFEPFTERDAQPLVVLDNHEIDRRARRPVDRHRSEP
jgi:hypothetical protein